MTWTVDGQIEGPERFAELEPIEILYELETPKIFTAMSRVGFVLVYESYIDMAERKLYYLAAPTSPNILSALKDGSKTVIQALSQPWVWAVKQDFSGKTESACQLSNGMNSVPDNCKPTKSAMLWPELMPLVSVRLVGAGLREGHIPASVIKRAADSIPSALKKCFDELFGAAGLGRPDESLRALYDLEAQQMAFNSFEISFRASQIAQLALPAPTNEDPYLRQGDALRNAIGWALEGSDSSAPSLDLVEAIEKLAPPMHGVVETVEVKGRIFQSSQTFVLTRAATKKVKGYLSEQRALVRSLLTVDGVVDELDKGRFTFTLRQTSDGKDRTFTFTDEFYDDVLIAFNSSARVSVSGRQIVARQPIEVLGIGAAVLPILG
jgi:hypothetical protein